MPFHPSQQDCSFTVCWSHWSHFGISVALCASTNLLLLTFHDYLFNMPYSISASLQEKVNLNCNFPYRLLIIVKNIDLHVLLFFKSRNCFISTDVREYLCTLSHVNIHVNLTYYNDNLINGHNQNYCRKSYFNRNAELWNLLPSRKKIHYFSSFKTSLNNIYLSKRETYNPPGYRYTLWTQNPWKSCEIIHCKFTDFSQDFHG